jgi:hypothetical protein
VTCLVTFESDTWRLERDDLVRALASDWPQAEVSVAHPDSPGAEVRAVEWIVRSEHGMLEGYAHSNGQCVYLEGPIELVADFAVWYRRLLPADLQVIFCDESYSFDGVIPPDAVRGDVLAIVESAGQS